MIFQPKYYDDKSRVKVAFAAISPTFGAAKVSQ
jgi:hypothetical protein